MDTLRPYLYGSRVLDLFAGQGRFGLAALEEEASQVEFVERDKATALAIQKALPRGASADVHAQDVFNFLRGATGAPFDLVFADPPFPLWEDEPFGHTLAQAIHRVLADDGILVLKTPSRIALSLQVPGLEGWKEKAFGESNLLFFRKK